MFFAVNTDKNNAKAVIIAFTYIWQKPRVIPLIPNIATFHSNTKSKVDKFVGNQELVITTDTHYLGDGMYFWDNRSNADFWANKKLREERDKGNMIRKILICGAKVILTRPILDMTDKDQIIKVQKLWNVYCDKTKEKNRRQCSGTILNILRKFFSEEFEPMKVSKGHGDYSHWKKVTFLANLSNNTYLDSRPKTIYAVHDNEKLVEREYIGQVTV